MLPIVILLEEEPTRSHAAIMESFQEGLLQDAAVDRASHIAIDVMEASNPLRGDAPPDHQTATFMLDSLFDTSV